MRRKRSVAGHGQHPFADLPVAACLEVGDDGAFERGAGLECSQAVQAEERFSEHEFDDRAVSGGEPVGIDGLRARVGECVPALKLQDVRPGWQVVLQLGIQEP